jgi:hypothetical protein
MDFSIERNIALASLDGSAGEA